MKTAAPLYTVTHTLDSTGCSGQPLTWTDVMEPFLVVVILSCMVPMSVARVGW